MGTGCKDQMNPVDINTYGLRGDIRGSDVIKEWQAIYQKKPMNWGIHRFFKLVLSRFGGVMEQLLLKNNY